jgi:hypothetical protein
MYILIYEYGFLVCVTGTDPCLLSICKKRKKNTAVERIENNNKRRNINAHLSGGSSGQ